MRGQASQRRQEGFTLVELLVAMVIALVVLAGMTAVFVNSSKQVSDAENRNEILGDLQLAASIIETELRQARGVCWDAANTRLIYRPLDSATPLPAACNAVAASNGAFQLRAASPNANPPKPTPYICWDRPNKAGGCQEMARNMKAGTGLTAFQAGGVWSITLTGEYQARDGAVRDLTVDIKTFPRNQ